MIQYIIAAGIGAFLGSQSKKSKKSYAKGAKGKMDTIKDTKEHFGFDNVDWSELSKAEQKEFRELSYKQLQGGSTYAHGGYVMDDYTLTLKPDSTIINEVYKGKYDDDTLDMSESFNRTWSIKQEQYDKLKSNKPITIEGGNVSWEWRFTVTRDMVEKVEKRTITKKEVKFAKGGKVELHKHPQGHWMLINPLSFQVGEDFVNEQDAKDYAWNNGIELTNSSYAEGGFIVYGLRNDGTQALNQRAKTKDEAERIAKEMVDDYKKVVDTKIETFKGNYAKGGKTRKKVKK